MSSTITTRRHRAGENPNGRPARDLVDQYLAAPARNALHPVATR